MTPGLPGSGLSLVFYIASALWMPLDELWKVIRGKGDPSRWKGILPVTGLALGVTAALGGALALMWNALGQIEPGHRLTPVTKIATVVLLVPGLLISMASLFGFPVLRRVLRRNCATSGSGSRSSPLTSGGRLAFLLLMTTDL
jgi:hypothetical protein